jgi:hypothetical protein
MMGAINAASLEVRMKTAPSTGLMLGISSLLGFWSSAGAQQREGTADTVITGNFAEWATAALADLDPETTLDAWRRKHPRERFALFSRTDTRRFPNVSGGDDFPVGDWCARASLNTRLPDGTAGLRRVYFYPPSGNREAVPSEQDGGRLPGAECRMGLIMVRQAVRDSARGSAMALAVRTTLERRYGTGPRPLQPPAFFHAAGVAFWRVGPRGFAVAYNAFRDSTEEELEEETDPPAEDWSGVVALHYGAHPTIGDDEVGHLDADDQTRPRDLQSALMSGMRAAELDARLAAPLQSLWVMLTTKVLPLTPGGHATIPVPVDSFIRPLVPWLSAARRLPAARRAGALLAADALLQYASDWGLVPVDSVSRARLTVLGATFEFDIFDRKEFFYSGGWRRAAFEAGPAGDLRHELFEAFVERAPPCTSPQWIVSTAEREARTVEGTYWQARAHLAAARALGDIFVDSGADSARGRALEHYRIAVAESFYDRDLDRQVWREAWRLAAGLAPIRLQYYCSTPD